jgi:delta 1-pyrroline-5-carboxylate dehydrogenase
MDTSDAFSVGAERNQNLHKAKLENAFYDIVNGDKISSRKRLSAVCAATNKELATVLDVERALLATAISAARNTFSGWNAVPFARRKAILASLLKRMDDHADELSALLSAEQGVTLAGARWEINLLIKAFGPALMQMGLHEKEQDVQPMKRSTKRYVPIDASGFVCPRNLPVILSFGKVLPALLAGDTVVLRPSTFTPVTVLRISGYICELLPPGVFNVVTGGHDLGPAMTSHSGIDLISFTRSAKIEEPALESVAGTLELGEDDSRTISDPGRIALFGSIDVVPIIGKPGRHGLARTLFEILSFEPTRMKTQVLVWSLARKASYTFPSSRCQPDISVQLSSA